jgi:hypothetical protein
MAGARLFAWKMGALKGLRARRSLAGRLGKRIAGMLGHLRSTSPLTVVVLG